MLSRNILLGFIIFLWPIVLNAEESKILINEICWMGTSNSSNDEWIELYNSSNEIIDLTGWVLKAEDGNPTISLEGIINPNDYFLLERTDDESVPAIPADQIYTGSLGNTGEWLKLFDDKNNLIDQIKAIENWPGGDNNAKQTLERVSAGVWQTSLNVNGTPKAQNSAPNPQDQDEENNPDQTPDDNITTEEIPSPSSDGNTSAKAVKEDIVINEIFPNPVGVDSEMEFIEIKNISNKSIDLTNWIIKNSAGQAYTLPSLKMMPNSIVVFYRHQTNLVLNNTKDKIKIYSTSNLIIDEVEYKSPAQEDRSFQRNQEGKYFWQDISAGKENIFNQEIMPIAVINGLKEVEVGELIDYDASDSFDPENRDLNFVWDFGDGRRTTGITSRQIYIKPGEYELILKAIVNESASSTTKIKIEVNGPSVFEDPQETKKTKNSTNTTEIIDNIKEEIPFIFISEFLPNPEGSDEAEFIEIFSNNEATVDLGGFVLDDADGGSKSYTIPVGTIIKPGQYLAFFRTETKIALNNDKDEIRFFSPAGTLIDYADYDSSKEGQSFILDEQFNWQISLTPSPGEINVLDNVPDATIEKNNLISQKETEPKILGVSNAKPEKNNYKKYLISGLILIFIIGIGGFLKFKNRL